MSTEGGAGANGLDETTRLAAEALARRAGLTLNEWVRQKVDEEGAEQTSEALAVEQLALRVAALERLVKLHGQRLSLRALGLSKTKGGAELSADSLNQDYIAAAAAAGAEPGRKLRPTSAYAVLARLSKSAGDVFGGPTAAFEHLETRCIADGKTGLALIREGRAVEVIAYLEKRGRRGR